MNEEREAKTCRSSQLRRTTNERRSTVAARGRIWIVTTALLAWTSCLIPSRAMWRHTSVNVKTIVPPDATSRPVAALSRSERMETIFLAPGVTLTYEHETSELRVQRGAEDLGVFRPPSDGSGGEPIGTGAYGRVYLYEATDGSGERIALKVIPPRGTNTHISELDVFRGDIDIRDLYRTTPHLVRARDVASTNDDEIVAMEYMNKRGLDKAMERSRRGALVESFPRGRHFQWPRAMSFNAKTIVAYLVIADEIREQVEAYYHYNPTWVYSDMGIENVLANKDHVVTTALGDLGSMVPGYVEDERREGVERSRYASRYPYVLSLAHTLSSCARAYVSPSIARQMLGARGTVVDRQARFRVVR